MKKFADKKLNLWITVVSVFLSVSVFSLSLRVFAVDGEHIKWVSFTPSLEALNKAYSIDVSTKETSYHLTMAESLAYYSSKKGDKYSSFSASELDSLLERLKNGESFSDITSSLKSFNYYKEAYDGVLSQFVGSYQREKSDGSVENTYGLKVFSPVAKGYYYSHSDDFGAGRSFGFKRKHLGHDLMGSIGSPIIAVESGVVSMVGWNMYGGWRVGISSFDGKRYYYYAHLRKDRPYNQNIKIGEVVAAGDVIGYLGATGYSTTENTNGMNVPHLHFGLQLIFDESQREGNREIWIDVYNLTLFLEKNKSTVFKDTESGEYKRKYRFYEDSLRDHGFSAIL